MEIVVTATVASVPDPLAPALASTMFVWSTPIQEEALAIEVREADKVTVIVLAPVPGFSALQTSLI